MSKNPRYLSQSGGPIPWPYVRDAEHRAMKTRLAKSINESLSAESEAFANYLAEKLMRDFNVTAKT